VQSLTPLLTAIFGKALLHEQLRLDQWLGLVGADIDLPTIPDETVENDT
jgi:threonine/homoserine efflux transporter RhtA